MDDRLLIIKPSFESAMLEVKLTPELDSALSEHARRERKSKTSLVQTAVERYLEDLEDIRDAKAELRRMRGKKGIPLAQVKKELGLVG